jgi:hypothetical protein
MPYQKYPQFSRNGLRYQFHDTSSAHPQGGVLQDKRAKMPAREASEQPASGSKGERSAPLQSNHPRSQKSANDDGPLEQLTLRVKPRVKRRLRIVAEGENTSLSYAGAEHLEKALQNEVDMSYGAMLKPAFDAIVHKRLTKSDARMVRLLVRNVYGVERLLIIATNILSRMAGVTPAILDAILDKADRDARVKIAKRTPQLEDIIQELEEIVAAKEEQVEEESKKPPAK